jgi:hypothetical protein
MTECVASIVVTGAPSESAKPSSNSSRCGASIAVTSHQPYDFSPAGPVM